MLAYSVDADSIYAVPPEIDEAGRATAAICGALGDCSRRGSRGARRSGCGRQRPFVYVRRQVSPDAARRVSALDLNGIGFIKENRRFYPKKELAAHLLGYVGIDNVGLGGIEAAYDSLHPRTGRDVLIQTDARRQAFSRIERPPTAGADLELTIDENLQHIAERELRAGVRAQSCRGRRRRSIMDPRTGEILALANEPTFNPNTFRDVRRGEPRAIARVQDLYEPGSTFKIVTASAAIEEKVMSHRRFRRRERGPHPVRRRAVIDDDAPTTEVLSFTDVIVKSSNVGAIKVGLRLGAERLGRYVSALWLRQALSPDFPGENPGIVWNPARLNDSALASVSMGYQVGVTPLQMATAVSSIANGGELLQPRVVRAVDARRQAGADRASKGSAARSRLRPLPS